MSVILEPFSYFKDPFESMEKYFKTGAKENKA